MNVMVERVARAICRAHGLDPDSDRNSDGRGGDFYTEVAWPEGMDRKWNHFEGDARVAIAAMRSDELDQIRSDLFRAIENMNVAFESSLKDVDKAAERYRAALNILCGGMQNNP